MIYLTRMLGKPVVDATGDEIGTIYDIAIATGEIFPRVTVARLRRPRQDAVHAVVAQVRRRRSTTSASRSTPPRADAALLLPAARRGAARTATCSTSRSSTRRA